MLAKSKQIKIRIVPLARIVHHIADAPACSSTDFSLCAFPRIPRKSKPHRLKPVLLEARMRLLNDIADAAGHLTGAGVEQAKIVRARPFRAHRRTSISQCDASVSREIPSRRRRRAAKSANSRGACGAA